jgi:hypothetical protein
MTVLKIWDGSAWVETAIGAQGPTGATGTNGTNGIDGKTILNGSGVPSSGLGVNGDFYIDTTASRIYGPKASGAWGGGVSLIGPAGTIRLSSSSSSSTVSNSTTETALLSTNFTGAQNQDLYKLVAYGTLLSNAAAATTYTWRYKIGSTSSTAAVIATGAISIGVSANNRPWRIEVDLNVAAIGPSSPSQLASGMLYNGAGGATWNAITVAQTQVGYGSSATDMSGTTYIDFTVQMGTASATATATINGWYLLRVR